MITKGIRGAITVDSNTVEDLKSATLELLNKMIESNNIEQSKISHVIFTLTDDLNCAFPARFARQDMGWNDVAMMCFHELDVPNSLAMCLRILIVYNADDNFKPEYIYLKGASGLRK